MSTETKEKITVGFSYGCLAPSIESQAIKQGYTLGKEEENLEKCRKAIITLRFGIDVPDSIHEKLTQRLHKHVVKSLKLIKKK